MKYKMFSVTIEINFAYYFFFFFFLYDNSQLIFLTSRLTGFNFQMHHVCMCITHRLKYKYDENNIYK